MGVKAGNVYALGVQLGTSSFFASVGDTTNAKKGLGYALTTVQTLAQQGIALNQGELNQAKANPTQSKVEALRGDYRNSLSTTAYLHVYDFGVGVGIAEGESSVPGAAPHAIARDSMTNAAKLEKSLLQAGYGLVPVTDQHDVIQMLRQQWQQSFSNSPLG